MGFSAQTFIVYNPANGKMEPVLPSKRSGCYEFSFYW
nr:hypothetical protein [Arsenophonus apicola]